MIFFKVNQTIMTTSQRHRNEGGIGHSITLIIKSIFCTVAQFVPEVCVSVSKYSTKQHFCTVVF